jgi:phage-related protein
MYEASYYEDRRGDSPTEEFLDTLPPKVYVKAMKWIEKLEVHGPQLPRPYADVVRGKIRELCVNFGEFDCRLLYFFFGKKIIITHGFLKKTTAIPVSEVERAERYMQDFLVRQKSRR